ncbi:MAG: ABC-F family ATP-binding cassette domain-containing protein [Reyranellaceae bacterium]
MLSIVDLTYRVGGQPIFEQASLSVAAGKRVGLVGRNGAGKSTLLKLIDGELQPDQGAISIQPGLRVGRMAQDPPDGPESLLETVLAADIERAGLLAAAETATDPQRIAEIHNRLADIQSHSAPARAARILDGLGFDHAAQQRPCNSYSGGWRMRVALAAVLFSQPDLLLLDEPSNHLDLEARLWLESYLRNYPHTLILVSHDRDLLNGAIEQIAHIDAGKLVAYTGNYDRFERTRRERQENLMSQAARQQAQRKHLQEFVDRFRAKASKARQAQSRLKMIEKLEPVVLLAHEKEVGFDFPSPAELPPPLITIENGQAGYGGRPVLSGLNLRIDMDDRIALLGANGNGKSTLVRVLSDRLKLQAGSLRKSGKLRVGYFAQHQTEELDMRDTPLDHVRRLMPDANEQKLRNHLGRFYFSGTKATLEVGRLSGGERTRLLFALMSVEAPHILLLDEPTNHLDMDAREALIEALNDYRGAVVLVSHDTHLLRLVADTLWLVADGACRPYDGDLDDYQRLLLGQRGGEDKPARVAGPPKSDARPVATETARERRKSQAEIRARLAPLRKAVSEAEAMVARLGKKNEAIRQKLADPALYSGPAEAIRELQIEAGSLQNALAEAEGDWLEANERLEAAERELREAAEA